MARDFEAREQDPAHKLPKAHEPRLWRRKVAYGTADCSQGPAMSEAQCAMALRNGSELVRKLPGNALLLGEMGIGNTSSASLLLARLCGEPVEEVTGVGTGLSSEGLVRKIAVLRRVLDFHAGVQEPLAVLAAMGGLEIATMTGAVLQAAAERRLIVVDGFITTAAVLVASRLQPMCCSAVCMPIAQASLGMPACWLTSRPSPCWTGSCAWAKALARRWPGRCCARHAPCSTRWPALNQPASAARAEVFEKYSSKHFWVCV